MYWQEIEGKGIKPRLLDLFCGAGGSAMGLHRAGFEVVGVDIKPQPHYPFEFHQADALIYPLEGYNAYWASPPCQFASQATKCRPKQENAIAKHPNLIAPIRDRLLSTDKPFIIENVRGARCFLVNPIMLCGTMLGLRVRRHRYFECHPEHQGFAPAGCSCMGKGGYTASSNGFSSFNNRAKLISVAGHNFAIKDGRKAMGIDWMSQAELSQAIPPAYSEYLGKYLLGAVLSQAVMQP